MEIVFTFTWRNCCCCTKGYKSLNMLGTSHKGRSLFFFDPHKFAMNNI